MRVLPVILVFVLLQTGPSAPQGSQPPPAFDEVVEVRVVNVDVFVRDKKGEPITGLTQEDFRLFEDGREVPISHFEAYGSPAVTTPPPSSAPASAPPPPPPAREEPLRVVVYLDNESLVKAERSRLLSGLGALGSAYDLGEVRFAVVTHDGKLNPLTGFTRDFDLIETALAQVSKSSAGGIDAVSDYRRSMGAIRSVMEGFGQTDCGPCECGWDQLTQIWEGYAQRSGARGYRSAMALNQLVDSLAAMPGRKAVVWASAGLQKRPGISLAQYLVDLCPDPRNELDLMTDRTERYDAEEIIASVGARANAARVTFYALGALGGAPPPTGSIEASARLRPSMTTVAEGERNRRDGLRLMAETTGGREFSKAGRVVEELDKDSSNFYSLAFTPASPPDDEVHEIRVELRNPGSGDDLRFRRSYRNKPALERLADKALGALWFGTAENGLALKARFGSATPAGELFNLPLGILVPTAEMTARGGGDEAASAYLRLVLVSRAPDGGVEAPRQMLLEIGPEILEREEHMIRIDLRMASGSHDVAFALRDETSRILSVMRLSVDVPAGG